MKRIQIQRLLAGLLCVIMLSGNDGVISMAATSSELLYETDNVNDTESEPDKAEEEMEASAEKETESSDEAVSESYEEEQKQVDVEDVDAVLADVGDNEETVLETEIAGENLLNVSASEDGFVINSEGILTEYNGTETDIVIPEGVIKIGDSVFNGKTFIKSVRFPSTLKEIGNHAFKSVSFGEVELDGEIIKGTLTIPGTVTSIGVGAFNGCSYLGEVIFEDSEEVLTIDSSGYWNDLKTFGNLMWFNCLLDISEFFQ